MQSYEYVCLRCPKCGKIGTGMTQDLAAYVYKCRRCGSQTKLKSENKFGFRAPVYAVFDNATQASAYCRELNVRVANAKIEKGWRA